MRPYRERTFSRDRTISARKSAGTKRPRNSHLKSPVTDGRLNAPPMNLSKTSTFLDIDAGFDYSATQRVMDGRVPLAKKYV